MGEGALHLMNMFWKWSPRIDIRSEGKMKRKWCFLPAATKQKNAAKVSRAAASFFLFFFFIQSTVALLQVNEIWWLIHVICLCCIGNSHCVVIEKWAPSTVSYQTACRMFKYAIPVCSRNIQFEVSLLLMNNVSTLWPLAHSGEKTQSKLGPFILTVAWCRCATCLYCGTHRVWLIRHLRDSSAWEQLDHIFGSGGILTPLINCLLGPESTIFLLKTWGSGIWKTRHFSGTGASKEVSWIMGNLEPILQTIIQASSALILIILSLLCPKALGGSNKWVLHCPFYTVDKIRPARSFQEKWAVDTEKSNA